MDMGVGVPMRMPVVMRMAMSVVVMMSVGRGGNHAWTLYYNITTVHVALTASRSPSLWRLRRTEMAPRRHSGTRRNGPA